MATEGWRSAWPSPGDDYPDQIPPEVSSVELFRGFGVGDSSFTQEPGSVAEETSSSSDVEHRIHTGFWDNLVPDTWSGSTETPRRSSPPEVPGYEILGELGRGGMGVVYQARQVRLNRLVALKMILAGEHASADALQRLLAEGETIARLKHPNIVQIHAIGDCGGLPYVELEFVEGGSLAARLDGTAWKPRAAARLIESLSRAVSEAHRHGIVHRDLKPANILMTPDGAPKISDFGLAKSIEQESGLTRTESILGSPSYMAPEQAEGRTREVGPAADIYALGATLYELLTGRPPFVAPTVLATLDLVRNREPVSPRRLQPRVPRELETICLKCLEKEPHQRYESAEALAKDLDGFLNDEPIRVRRPSPWKRTLRWARRRPATAALLVLCTMAVFSSAATLGWHQTVVASQARAARLRDEAILTQANHFILLGQEAVRRKDWQAARTQSSSALALIRNEPHLAVKRQAAEHLFALSNAVIAGQKSREAARERYAQFQRLCDEAVFYQSDYTGMDNEANLVAARAAARRALAQFGLDKIDRRGLDLNPDHFNLQERGQIVDACYELTLLLAEAESQPLKGETRHRQAHVALHILDGVERLRTPTPAYHLRRASYLERLGERALAEQQRRLAETEPESASDGSSIDAFLMGQQAYRKGDLKTATAALKSALSLQPDNFWAQYLLAVCHLRAHRSGEAQAALIACQSRRPRFVWTYLLKGFIEGEMGEFALAEADFQRASVLGLSDQERYVMLVNRGVMRVRRGSQQQAIEDLSAAIQLNPEHYQAYLNLAQAYQDLKRWDDALSTLDQAIAIAADQAVLFRTRSQLHRLRLQPDAALSDLDHAIALATPEDPLLGSDYLERGLILQQAGRLQEALAACDGALENGHDRPEVHRLRGGVLLGLRQYAQAIRSFDVCLARGMAPQAIYEARGLARAWSGLHEQAVADYTMALSVGQGSPSLYANRAWAYLLSGAPAQAVRDFDSALHLDPSNGHALSGRAQAYVQLRKPSEAVADARRSVRLSPTDARSFYNAARVLCQAAVCLEAEPGRSAGGWAAAGRYRTEALEYLELAERLSPESQRVRFWEEVVRPDPVLEPLRSSKKFSALDARFARQSPADPPSRVQGQHHEIVAPPAGPRPRP